MTSRSRLFAALALASLLPAPSSAQPIPTPTVPVVDIHHGVAVPDPYRWLEADADPKVRDWGRAQTGRTRAYLDALPNRAAIRARIAQYVTAVSPGVSGLVSRPGALFAMLDDRAKQRPTLVVMNEAGDPATTRILLDPTVHDPEGKTAIDWFVPSPDGQLVGVSLSRSGTESGAVHLFEVATGKQVGEPIPRVQFPTAGGSLAWTTDGAGFWYTRYPSDERPEADRAFYQQLYFHRLGTDWRDDPVVLGTAQGLPRTAEIKVSNRYHRPLALASVQLGDGGEWQHYVLGADGPVRVADFPDKAINAVIGPDDAIYATSRADAPNGKVLRLAPPFRPGALPQAPVIVPEGEIAMVSQDIALTREHLLLQEIDGGPTRVRVFDHAGNAKGTLPLPELAAVSELVPLASGEVLVLLETYLRPPHVLRWSAASGLNETAIAQRSRVSMDDIEVVREFAVSADGTRIPVNIARRKGTVFDGKNPALLYGYGGYGTNETPTFLRSRPRLWLDAGGIYVIAVPRGGSEYGERWHAEGMLTRKQNVFDDFAAAARHLIARGYTSSDRLALYGASNGGLLMGAMMTQHPGLARAIVSEVGVYDMLRSEIEANGEFNITEFGTVKDPVQFKALYAYSPYHRVVTGTAYPAALLTAGENDNRVAPHHSRKFAAALQAATGSGRPIYLAISGAGHNLDNTLDQDTEQFADMMAFLFDQLGMKLP